MFVLISRNDLAMIGKRTYERKVAKEFYIPDRRTDTFSKQLECEKCRRKSDKLISCSRFQAPMISSQDSKPPDIRRPQLLGKWLKVIGGYFIDRHLAPRTDKCLELERARN